MLFCSSSCDCQDSKKREETSAWSSFLRRVCRGFDSGWASSFVLSMETIDAICHIQRGFFANDLLPELEWLFPCISWCLGHPRRRKTRAYTKPFVPGSPINPENYYADRTFRTWINLPSLKRLLFWTKPAEAFSACSFNCPSLERSRLGERDLWMHRHRDGSSSWFRKWLPWMKTVVTMVVKTSDRTARWTVVHLQQNWHRNSFLFRNRARPPSRKITRFYSKCQTLFDEWQIISSFIDVWFIFTAQLKTLSHLSFPPGAEWCSKRED